MVTEKSYSILLEPSKNVHKTVEKYSVVVSLSKNQVYE